MSSIRKLTEMSKARFCELLSDLDSGELSRRWAGEKEPETRKERTEANQIRAMGVIADSGQPLSDLASRQWSRLELWAVGDSMRLKVFR